jgi:hypothetical protein
VLANQDMIARCYNLVYHRQYEAGGQFAAAESPDAI